MTGETAAERRDALYVDELRRSVLPPIGPRVNRRQTEALITRTKPKGASNCT